MIVSLSAAGQNHRSEMATSAARAERPFHAFVMR
jgi:hypothetical protein